MKEKKRALHDTVFPPTPCYHGQTWTLMGKNKSKIITIKVKQDENKGPKGWSDTSITLHPAETVS